MKRATHFIVQPGWRLLISDMGVNPDHVLRLASLPADLFSRKDASVTTQQYFGLYRALEEAAGSETLLVRRSRSKPSIRLFLPACAARISTSPCSVCRSSRN